MNPKSPPEYGYSLIAKYGAALLSSVLVFASYADIVAAVSQPVSGSESTPSARTNLADRPLRELYNLAERGDVNAQYWFGTRQWNSALEESMSPVRRAAAAAAEGLKLSDPEKESARKQWKDASELALHEAANAGDRGARWYLGAGEVDHPARQARDACEWIQRAANAGVPGAEYELGCRYLDNQKWRVFPLNYGEGLKWLRKSAENGFEAAQHKLADYLLLGAKVPPDLDAGIRLLQRAADQNCARAQYELASHYVAGEGEPRSTEDTPLALLQRSARSGYRTAQTALGNRYRMGFGVPRDLIAACRFYRAGAALDEEGNYLFSRVDITRLLDRKLEPLLNPPPGMAEFIELSPVASLYLKATERMDAEAMCRIGDLYGAGKLVPKDFVEVCRWYEAAARRGNATAAKSRDQLKPQLTSDQLAEAAREPQDLRPFSGINHQHQP